MFGINSDKKEDSICKTLKNLCDELNQINYKDKTDEMEKIIAILKDIVSKDSLEEFFENENEITFFSNKFIPSILENIGNQSYVHGKNGDDIALDLLFEIYRLFSRFHHNKKYSKIFESIRNQFKDYLKLSFFFPQNKINNPEDSNDKKKLSYKEFNRIFCKDFISQEKKENIFNVGDRVDILVDHEESSTFIDQTAWVRGIIKKRDDKNYYIEYNGEGNEITFPLSSQKVQPEGKRTEDWEWRTNLQIYSLVDVFERDKWWPCTIYDIKDESENNGIKRVKYRIGLRLYKNHFKNEDDPFDSIVNYFSFWEDKDFHLDEKNKEEYRGEPPENDIYLFHFSKRIQKFNHYSEIQIQSKEGGDTEILDSLNTELAKDNIPENEEIDDYFLYEKNNRHNIIIGKSGNFSFYYACLLKKIEKLGDFEEFINILKNKPNFEELITIFTILLNSLEYIHFQYIQNNKEIFKLSLINYINDLDDKHIKNFEKNKYDSVLKFLNRISEINNNSNEKKNGKEIEEEIWLILAFRKIKTTFFDKRIEGVKYIDEYLKKKNEEKYKEKICTLIKNNKIINEIFGPNYHSQIISKSTEIVKLLIKSKMLDKEDVNLIWGCTQKGDLEAQRTIIDLLKGLLQDYDEEFLGLLLDSLVNLSDRKPNEQETDFVHKISQITKSQENKKKICQYFCKCLLALDTISKKNSIFEKLLIMMSHDESYLIQVLKICERNMKENKYTLICNSLILALLEKFVIINDKNENGKNNNNNPPYISLKDSLTDFLNDEHLLKIFEDNFEDYMEKARNIYESEKLDSRSEIIIEGNEHSQNIDGRLAFLNKIIKYYPNYYFFPKLKEILLDKPVVPEDKTNFFKFIQFYITSKNYENETKKKTKIALFETLTEFEQNDMSYNEFKLFIILFFYINSQKFDFNIIEKNDDDEEYIIKIKPDKENEEVKEIDELWKIIYEVNDEKIINKLIKIIYEIQPNKQDILENIAGTIEGEEDKEKIQKCYKLLELFLIESEKNINIDIKSHNSLLRNSIIKFPLEIQNVKNNINQIELFYDNASLNEIKEEIVKKFKIPMNFIEVFKKEGEKEKKLDYTFNNKSLKELVLNDMNISDNNNINFNNIIIFKIKKKFEIQDLIIDKEPIPYLKNLLKEFFYKFTEGTGKMDKEYCSKLLTQFTNYNVHKSSELIKQIFDKFDKKELGFINEDNFYKFYIEEFLEKGINNIIEINKFVGNKENVSIDIKHNEKEQLFRFILCSDEFMKDFIENYNKYEELNYKFFFLFPTKENIYKEILEKFNEDSEIFNNIFKEDSNILKQLYYLIIIESFLQDIELSYIDPKTIFKNSQNLNQVLCSNKYIPFETYDINAKKKFFVDFIKNKMFENLINYIIDILKKYKNTKNEVMKKCCIKGLKIIKILFEASFDFDLKQNLIEENIYYLDYSHIKNILKDKQEIKEIIRDYSYSIFFRKLNKYLSDDKNNTDDLFNECFDVLIKLFAFNEKTLNNIISNENSKKSFYDLLKKLISSNSFFIIKSLTDTLKKYYSFSFSSKFIDFIYDIMETIISFTNDDNCNLLLSEGFFEFYLQINDCKNNKEKDPNNKLLLKIIENLINNIYERNSKKKLSNSIFIKYMKLIIKLIEKNSKIKQQIISYKIKDKTLSSSILEKIIFKNLNSKENENQTNENKNEYSNDDDNEFISLDNKEFSDDSTENELKNICLSYIFESLNNPNNSNTIKEIMTINKNIKNSLEIEENKSKEISNNMKSIDNSNKKDKKDFGHVGLYNLGSICYMNSVMQQLYMVPSFRYAIIGCDDNQPPKPYSAEKYGKEDDNLFHQLQVMFSFLLLSEKKYFFPQSFCHSYKDYDGNPTNPKIQQDCQEFYSNFLDKIEKCLQKTKYKYIINDIFMGKSCSSVICKECNHVSNSFEDLYYLSLEVNNINNLNDSLRKFIKPERVEGFKCESCQNYVAIEKRTTLYKLPNTLFIHLKRFSMNYDLGTTQKTNSRFDFEPKINLKKFCVEMFQNGEINEFYFKNDEYYEYFLKGIVVHLGNAGGGHYISLIDIKRDGKENIMFKEKQNQKWLKFNDSEISQFEFGNIPSECYGGENVFNSQCAYLLIYERIQKTPIRIIIDINSISEKQKENIINYKKVEENDINIKYDIRKINNEIKEEELYKLIFHNEDQKEYYKYIPYYNIQKCCPKKLLNKIMEDNKSISMKKIIKNDKNFMINTQNKIKDLLYSEISNKNFIEKINNFNENEKFDLVDIILKDISKKLEQDDFTQEEKEEINKKMNLIICNLINPLINQKQIILENIKNFLIEKNNIKKIFSNEKPLFNATIVDLIQNLILNLIKTYESTNILKIFEIFNAIIEFLKNIKENPKNKEINESNPIKYIYKIIEQIININESYREKCIEENLIKLLIIRIENECPSNQDTIINILNTIISSSQEYKKLFNFQSSLLEGIQPAIRDKSEINKIILNNKILKMFYEKNSKFLFTLIEILEKENSNFSKTFNFKYIPSLLEFSTEKKNLISFIDLCLALINIKDSYCLERMKQLLGFPVMIIKPIEKNQKNIKMNQKFPFFGYELIKNNNYDIKTEIYKYECFYKKKKLCLLSYFLPDSDEKIDKNISEMLNNDIIKGKIDDLLLKCLSNGGNYSLFKYLYLLPARTISDKNAYEELKSISDKEIFSEKDLEAEKKFIDNINYQINRMKQKENPKNKNLKSIEKPEFPLEISQNNPNIEIVSEFMGFKSDFLPGEIVKEEIQSIVKNKYLELLRIEYTTKYYEIDENNNIIYENKDKDNTNKTFETEESEKINKTIETEEKFDEKDKILRIDIFNSDYQIEENKLFEKLSKKLEKAKKIIIEDSSKKGENTKESLIRYILINKKPINNKIEVKIECEKDSEKIKKNSIIPEFLINYVDKHNYVNFLNLYRLKNEQPLIRKNDIIITIDSKAYIEK